MNPKIKLIKGTGKNLKITKNLSRRKLNYCSECQLQFGNNSIFRLHIRLVHMPEMKNLRKFEVDPIIFPCSHCKERFSSITTYEMHFRYIHADILVKQHLEKIECQQIVVNSLKLRIKTLEQQSTERERHVSFLTDTHARVVKDLENKVEGLITFKTCKVCTNREINTVFMPCGHCITCDICADHDSIANCPICRTEIFTKLRIGF